MLLGLSSSAENQSYLRIIDDRKGSSIGSWQLCDRESEMHQNYKTQKEPSPKAITNIFEEN
jgi:hypothetical protein